MRKGWAVERRYRDMGNRAGKGVRWLSLRVSIFRKNRCGGSIEYQSRRTPRYNGRIIYTFNGTRSRCWIIDDCDGAWEVGAGVWQKFQKVMMLKSAAM